MNEHEVTAGGGVARSAWRLLSSAVSRFSAHRLTDWAAALTYYSMLSIFPGLIVIVSLLGLIGHSATGGLIENFEQLAPGPVRDTLIEAIRGIEDGGATAGVLLAVSLAVSLYSASSYVGAFIRASNIVWQVRERRRFFQTIPLRLGITALLVALVMGIALAVVATGPLADEMRRITGVDATSVPGFGALKWPVLAAMMALLTGILYNLAPNVDDRRFRPITAGSMLAVTLWFAGSLAFAVYVANFGSYNQTYGSLAGVVVFLVWLWLSNVAVLLGVELDAELRRYRREHGRSPFRRGLR